MTVNSKKYIAPRTSDRNRVQRRWEQIPDKRGLRNLIITVNNKEYFYPPKAGVIIFNEKLNKILIVKNKSVESEKNFKWGIPKGHIEKDELPHECAMRELYEETGIKLNIQINSKNCIKCINNTTYYVFSIPEKNLKISPIDKNEIYTAQFHYINRIKSSSNLINRELYKITKNYMKLIKKKCAREIN